MKKFTVAAALTIAAPVLVLGNTATPATSASATSWSVISGAGGGLSRAEASGTITFTSKTGFKFAGKTKDFCPGDGRGVAITFNLVGPDNSNTGSYIVNRGGCGSTVTGSGSISRAKTITKVNVRICWTDGSNACALVSTANSGYKSNPFA